MFTNSSNLYIKRFGSELITIQEQYPHNISCIVDKTTSTIRISFDNSRIRIVLTRQYPFAPPKVYLEDTCAKNNQDWDFLQNFNIGSHYHALVPYKQTLVTSSCKIRRLLMEHYGIQCLCCSEMTNTDLWLPTYDIDRVLKNINNHNKIRRNIKHVVMLDIIMEYKNMPEILVSLIIEYLREKE